MTQRSRGVLLLAALLGVLVSGATTVYLVGSHNRRVDRQDVLDYEARVTAEVREMNVVAGSMLNLAEQMEQRKADPARFRSTMEQFQATFRSVSSRLAAVPLPPAVGAASPAFPPAAEAYAEAAGRFALGARCYQNPVAAERISCADFNAARDRAALALARYRAAAGALQAARARLGLGPSPNFGEPPR